MRPFKAVSVLAHVVSFIGLASATANLQFYTPNFSAAPTTADGLPYLVQGDPVTITWYTSFQNTSLIVFQDLGNGTTLWELLAVAWPSTKTQQIWTAKSVGGHSLKGSKFFFFLQNSNNTTCTACNLTSSYFAIKAQASLPTSTSSQTSTTTPTSTHLTPSASGVVVANTVKPKTAGNMGVELGVGLGAGIPAVLALVGIFFLWLRHRRDKRLKDDENRGMPTEGQGPQMEKAPLRDSHLSRESGALGPYAQNPSPTWEQQEAREEFERHRRGSSTRHMPFRPSLGAHSEASDEDSRHSWIDDFDFERPGYRDTDEMSQAKRTIQAKHGSRRGYHEYSHSSIIDLADIPPMPQPVYQGYPDRHWPMR